MRTFLNVCIYFTAYFLKCIWAIYLCEMHSSSQNGTRMHLFVMQLELASWSCKWTALGDRWFKDLFVAAWYAMKVAPQISHFRETCTWADLLERLPWSEPFSYKRKRLWVVSSQIQCGCRGLVIRDRNDILTKSQIRKPQLGLGLWENMTQAPNGTWCICIRNRMVNLRCFDIFSRSLTHLHVCHYQWGVGTSAFARIPRSSICPCILPSFETKIGLLTFKDKTLQRRKNNSNWGWCPRHMSLVAWKKNQ